MQPQKEEHNEEISTLCLNSCFCIFFLITAGDSQEESYAEWIWKFLFEDNTLRLWLRLLLSPCLELVIRAL